MKKNTPQSSPRWLTGTVAGLAAFTGGEPLLGAPWVDLSDVSLRRTATPDHFDCAYDGILGTSLDLIVGAGRHADAYECEIRVLAEIERLRRILSTYDPASEISRVRRGASVESAELAELLAAYDFWSARTAGVVNVNMAGVIRLWQDAARTGRLPDRSALAVAVGEPRAFNVDALGKGFILDRAVGVARQFAPTGLLNIGGDIRAWGDTTWRIGLADPRHPADNAPLLASFTLRDAAVATSASYARFLQIGGQRYSHLIDPRTQWPAEFGGSATVVAADCVTANALSTAVGILGANHAAGLAIAGDSSGQFVVDPDGGVTCSGVLAAIEVAPIATSPANGSGPAASAADWPKDYQVAVNLWLKDPNQARAKRPYVAVWVADAKGQTVRTVTVWGTQSRYLPELTKWWRSVRSDDQLVHSVTRATRRAGEYQLTWDGRDDHGNPLPAGDYSIYVEINREHGHHVEQHVKLSCGRYAVSAELPSTSESFSSTIDYGPKTP